MKPLRTIQYLFRHIDWPLFFAVQLLVLIGLAAIYSVDLSRGTTLQYIPTQLIAFGIGIVLLAVMANMHMSVFQMHAKHIYIAAFLLLLLVLFFGVTVRGTTGWFRIFGFSFQPGEFAKIALVIFLGWWFQAYGRRFDSWQFVFTSGMVAALLAGCILLQPDLGSALIIAGTWFGLLLLSGTKKRYIALLLGILVALFFVSWFFVFEPYQKDRLLNFLHPERDPLGSGYNVQQSIIAIGSGGFIGRGLGFGSQSQLHFLPEAQTDFIFSVIAEELGFIGAGLVILLYTIIVWRLVVIALDARYDFASYTAAGIAVLLFLQFLVNIGGATGMLPVTGVTLPFVSYGGSSLIMSYVLIGVALSIAKSTRSISHNGA